MADEGVSKTDKKIKKVEKQINQVYKQAQEEIEEKMKSFNDKLVIKNSIKLQELKSGKITREDYQSWLAGQAFQAQQWNSKRDQICDILHNANAQATAIVNGGTIDTFAEGANWIGYSLEHTAGVNFGFGLYDSATVTNLIAENPDILPKWKIDEPKEYIWNKQKANNCVTQGIIQGESLDKIATRIATVTANQNRNLALTHARTAMTGAQNAGRTQRLQNAKKMGLKVVKQWMATLDGHTRDTHRSIDGETRGVGDQWHPMKFSNGCRYPGDPQGPAHEVFNCRCTLVGDLEDYPEEYQRYDNIDGVPIKNMTYKEWAKAKGLDKPKVPVVPKPSKPPIPDITEWIELARKNPSIKDMLFIEDKELRTLSDAEIHALRTYTGSAYDPMNNYLRNIGRGMTKEEAYAATRRINESIPGLVETLHNGMHKVSLDRDMVLRRGTDVGDLAGLFMQGDFRENKALLYNKTAEELNAMFQGQVGTYFGFTSTSSQWDSGFYDSVEVLFYAPKGTAGSSIMKYSQYGTGEGETLLADGTTVVCQKIEKSDGHMDSTIRVFLEVLTK